MAAQSNAQTNSQANEGVARVTLPSGGWWDIRARPLWRHVGEWRRAVRGGANDAALLERALVSLTTAWSFPDEIGPESIASRDAEDLVAVLEAFCRHAARYAAAHEHASDAERLFAALAAGRVPPDFADVHLMLATGWSWRELQETPADVVARAWTYLAVRETRDTGGELEVAAGASCSSPPS